MADYLESPGHLDGLTVLEDVLTGAQTLQPARTMTKDTCRWISMTQKTSEQSA